MDSESVANPRFRLEIAWPFRIILDLLPERADIDTEVLNVCLDTPHLTQDEFVGKHSSGMGDQETQEIVLARGELDLVAPYCDDPTHKVDTQVTRPEDRPLTPLLQTMALRGAHASQELIDTERFRDVIIGA